MRNYAWLEGRLVDALLKWKLLDCWQNVIVWTNNVIVTAWTNSVMRILLYRQTTLLYRLTMNAMLSKKYINEIMCSIEKHFLLYRLTM